MPTIRRTMIRRPPELVIYDASVHAAKTLTPHAFGMHWMLHPGETGIGTRGCKAMAARLHDYSPIIGGQARHVQWRHMETQNWAVLTEAQRLQDPGLAPLMMAINEHGIVSGRTVYFTAMGTPSVYSSNPTGAWAYGNNGGGYAPTDLGNGVSSSWGRFCRAVMTIALPIGARFVFEIQNEAHTTGTFTFFNDTPAKLAEMTRIARLVRDEINSQALIAAPSITSLAYGGSGWNQWATSNGYLTSSDGAGGVLLDHVDLVNVHLYVPPAPRFSEHLQSVLRIRRNMEALGKPSMPVHNTEWSQDDPGWSSFSVAQQIAFVQCMSMLSGGGLGCSIYYADGDSLKNPANAVITAYNDVIDYACSGPLHYIAGTSDGRLRCIVNNVEKIFSWQI